VLGMTPSFYASSPTAMPTDLGAWYRYVTAVVQRYRSWNGKRGIAAYQVWNEANVTNFWTGTTLDMAKLTQATRNAVKAQDKGAIVVGPAFAARIGEQIRGITRFAFARVDGVPAWKFADVLSLNLYPLDRYGTRVGTPEKSMELLAQARKLLGFGGVPASMPIWNTEVNYGMRTGSYGGTKASPIAAERQAAYVIRTYLLNASRKVKRVHWYSWNMGYLPSGGTLGNTLLTSPSDGAPTLAGKAFALVRGWMLGGTLVGASRSALPCAQDRKGTFTCVIKYSRGVKRVYWNPTKRVKVRTVKSATFMVGVYGKRKAIRGGSAKYVDYRPVMVRSKF
ncbi:MAG: GH39 family glycosyl hydrolase, partial [Actinomycetes bacterium]